MNFVYFPSKNTGININHIEFYSLSNNMQKLTIKMVGTGQRFFIDDEDEILYFLSFSTALEFDVEDYKDETKED